MIRPGAIGMWKIHGAGVAACLVVLGAVLALVVRPRLEAEAAAHEADRTLASLREESELALKRAKTAEDAAAALQKDLDAQPLTLGPASRLNDRIASVSASAEKLGLKILELVPGVELPAASHSRFPIRLRAAGPADAGPSLLRELHRQFPDLSVVSVKLSANPADSAESGRRALAQLAVDFEWYAERDGPPAPAAK